MRTSSERISGEKPIEAALRDNCFVIMPFGGVFDNYYKHIIAPVVEEAGLKPVRGNDISIPGAIMDQVWKGIREAQVCLADITGRNANVMYELGLAHAVGKPVIQIVQDLDDIPYDLQALRHIPYKVTDQDWEGRLKNQIYDMLMVVKEDPSAVLPPVSSLTTSGISSVGEYHHLISKAQERIWICQTWLPGVESYAQRILDARVRNTHVLLASFKEESPIFARIRSRDIEVDEAKFFVKNSVQRFVEQGRMSCVRFNYGHHPGWIAVIDSTVLWGPTPVDVDNHARNIFFSKDMATGARGEFWCGQFSLLWHGKPRRGKPRIKFCHDLNEETKYNTLLSQLIH